MAMPRTSSGIMAVTIIAQRIEAELAVTGKASSSSSHPQTTGFPSERVGIFLSMVITVALGKMAMSRNR
jgi:uncharacterized membrane protein YidH (DUF202 family)